MLLNRELVVNKPEEDSDGVRVKEKIIKQGFNEYLELSHVYIETFNSKNEVTGAIRVPVRYLNELFSKLRMISRRTTKKRVVKVELVK